MIDAWMREAWTFLAAGLAAGLPTEDLPPSFALAAGAPEFAWSYVGGLVVAWVITTALTWLVAARITTRVLTEQIQALVSRLDKIDSRMEAVDVDVRRVDRERMKCELHAGQNFSSQAQVAQVISEQATQWRLVMEKLDAVANSLHKRTTDNENRIARLEGAGNGNGNGDKAP